MVKGYKKRVLTFFFILDKLTSGFEQCKNEQIKECGYIFRNSLNLAVKLCNNTGNSQKKKMFWNPFQWIKKQILLAFFFFFLALPEKGSDTFSNRKVFLKRGKLKKGRQELVLNSGIFCWEKSIQSWCNCDCLVLPSFLIIFFDRNIDRGR